MSEKDIKIHKNVSLMQNQCVFSALAKQLSLFAVIYAASDAPGSDKTPSYINEYHLSDVFTSPFSLYFMHVLSCCV